MKELDISLKRFKSYKLSSGIKGMDPLVQNDLQQMTGEEIRILSQFCTNMDKPVFALRNLPEVVKGALFSRYSRAPYSLRMTLLREFIQKPEMGFSEIVNFQIDRGADEIVAIKKAEEFYDRVLVGYGDDSVAELGGAHIACENVSNIASKVLEDSRIGLSPLEKSTRYMLFNEKTNGEYRFYKDPAIMQSEFAGLYLKICNLLFDAYSSLVDPMMAFIREKYPQEEGTTDRAYAFTVKAKACDIIRVFLPAAALTNVGIFGNGRAFEYLLTKMYASELVEMRNLAGTMQEELQKVIPSFVKRANDQYGQVQQKFFTETINAAKTSASNILKESVAQSESVVLIDYDKEAEKKIAATILYSQSKHPMQQINEAIGKMSEEERRRIIHDCLNTRSNRRHRPGRPFEVASYTFDLLGNYAIYRDLQRHRMLTQERQRLTTHNGYDTPKELVEAGFADKYRDCMEKAREAFEEISERFPQQAQYIVPFGYRIRWYFHLNLRELYHLLELRTMRQGHPDYRKMCQEMFRQAQKVHPFLMSFMKFIDMNDYELERLESEKRIDKKMEEVKKKYGS